MMQPESMTIPIETQSVAQAAFPNGNRYMQMRDVLGELYSDEQFAALFPERGQPAAPPGRLALVTVMQFAEGLSDRQAADMVRARIDWKYALGLALTDTGFDYSVLSEFRTRLIAGSVEEQLLNTMLTVFKARGLLKVRGRQRTDSTHVLASRGVNLRMVEDPAAVAPIPIDHFDHFNTSRICRLTAAACVFTGSELPAQRYCCSGLFSSLRHQHNRIHSVG